jgi:hypothetical protein
MKKTHLEVSELARLTRLAALAAALSIGSSRAYSQPKDAALCAMKAMDRKAEITRNGLPDTVVKWHMHRSGMCLHAVTLTQDCGDAEPSFLMYVYNGWTGQIIVSASVLCGKPTVAFAYDKRVSVAEAFQIAAKLAEESTH